MTYFFSVNTFYVYGAGTIPRQEILPTHFQKNNESVFLMQIFYIFYNNMLVLIEMYIYV